MKRTVITIFLLSFILPCRSEGEINTQKNIRKTDWEAVAKRNLKPFGLAYCISKFHRGDSVPQDIQLSQSTYFEGSQLSNQAFHDLSDYIDRTIPKNILYTSLDMEPMYFLSCVDMYESADYINTVNGLVKKYQPQS